MSWLRSIMGRLSALFRKGRLDADLDDELRFHLEMEEQENVRNGMSAEEARRQARLRLGGMEQVKEEYRDRRGIPFLDSLLQDLRFAFRSFRRDPGFTATVLVTLALGIGVGTAIFAVANAILLRPLPYNDPDRLVFIARVNDGKGITTGNISRGDCHDWRDDSGLFDSLSCFFHDSYRIENEIYWGEQVDEAFCSTVGVQPLLGRCFHSDDYKVQAAGNGPGMVILQYEFWNTRFGADPGVLGQTFDLVGSGRPATIVGVMPPGFGFDLRIEKYFRPLFSSTRAPDMLPNHGAIARLKVGFTLEEAQARADVFSQRMADLYPDTHADWRYFLYPVSAKATEGVRDPLRLLLAASGLLLLIVCLNIAGLVLVRSQKRTSELVIRSAIGAARSRLIRQLITENVLLSFGGALLGLVVADLLTSYLRSWVPESGASHVLGADHIRVDPWVITFAIGVALLNGILVGLLPAFRGTSFRLATWIREGATNSIGNRTERRAQYYLSTAQVSVAVVLAIGSCLTVRSLVKLHEQGAGFRSSDLISLAIDARQTARSGTALEGEERRRYLQQTYNNFWQSLRSEIRGIPGIESVSFGSSAPMAPIFGSIGDATWSGKDSLTDEVSAGNVWAGVGYFQILGIPLLEGRVFDETDSADSTLVAIVNEEAARLIWPDQSPLGKAIRKLRRNGYQDMTIVGVVGSVREDGLREPPRPIVYEAGRQIPVRSVGSIVAKSSQDKDSLLSMMVQRIRGRFPEVAFYVQESKSLDHAVNDSVWELNYSMLLLVSLAGLALLVSSVGIYGVLSYSVRQRTREIGLRIALGAEQSQVVGMVLRQGLFIAVPGVVVGLLAAAGLTRFLGSLLYGVEPLDPSSFAVVALFMLAVAVLASYLPARQAAKLNPRAALHCD